MPKAAWPCRHACHYDDFVLVTLGTWPVEAFRIVVLGVMNGGANPSRGAFAHAPVERWLFEYDGRPIGT